MVALLLSPLGRGLLAAGGVLLIITLFGAQQRSLGEAEAVKKMEGKDNATAAKINEAGRVSGGAGSGRVRARRDPNAVSE
jgi:hypothetical protein